MDHAPQAMMMSVLFLSMAAIFVLRGPLGKALADRIAGRARVEDPDAAELRGELDQVRRELAEVQERLDFAERLLAKQGTAERLAPPR